MSKIDAVTIKTHMGKIPQKYSSTVPRWKIRMDPFLLNEPDKFVHAYAHKAHPIWFVFYRTEWTVMSDGDFLGTYQPSNREARENITAISKRRDISKAVEWRTA